MATAKQAHTLTSYFINAYKERYGTNPVVNRNISRWNFDTMLEDMDSKEIKDLIDYYFETVSQNGHSIKWFFYNYDDLIVGKAIRDKDNDNRKKLLEATRKRTEEWKAKIGNN